MPTDLMIFSPPTLVPRAMTTLHKSMSHTGISMPLTEFWPWAKAAPKNRTPMNFWPSWAPCMKMCIRDRLSQTRAEIDHLESISTSMDIARLEEDLVQIKEELTEYGYIRRHYSGGKKVKITSRPYHYLSSDGFHIYVEMCIRDRSFPGKWWRRWRLRPRRSGRKSPL